MIETHTYLMPDYYPDFSCKMGACRAACCEGWPVSLSLEDYYKLVGMDCSADLRRNIDCALHLLDDPFPDRYAQLSHRYDGRCHLRMNDGRCALQAELGEDALPCICRLYPRAVRSEGDFECSCANSCERVVEMLLRRPAPLTFIKNDVRFNLPKQNTSSIYKEFFPNEQSMRLYLIGIMQNRADSLPMRFFRLSVAMQAIERGGSFEDIRAAAENASIQVSRQEILDHLPMGLEIIDNLIAALDCHSDSLRGYGEAVREHAHRGGTLSENYLAARSHFESAFPHWSEGFENLLVNHMFFSRFPFADNGESMKDEYVAFSALYGMMRVLSIGWMATHGGEDALVDLLSAIFRLVDHSSFHQYAAQILQRKGVLTPDQFAVLVNI